MEQFSLSMRTIARYIFLLFSMVVVCWLFMPQRVFFQGLLLGIFVSMCNGFILYVKTVQASEVALNTGRRMRGLGMLPRFLLTGFAVYVSFRLPHLFSFYGVVAGLPTVPILTLLVTIYYYISTKQK
ncbi:ATP synthase protein I [Aneurinibacillus soli]|uniref:ATP synthase I chain n=2 Tax=Aneurinibacillus soli TaxID=1500254 RepID=A0A0U5AZS8_9BACL|nr:ATP synthase subunit I [Aneurinibacillus soli]PYE61583.1 ATP synthase protein I [Aneurinibacillus soli]BAU26463.1 ATP synthase I chain [Aneurinibacillus soli]